MIVRDDERGEEDEWWARGKIMTERKMKKILSLSERGRGRLKENIRSGDRPALATGLFTVYFGLQSHFSSYWQSRDDFLFRCAFPCGFLVF